MQYYSCFIIISSGLKDIIAGIELFNKADFFAAHDFFEDCWFDCERKQKFFFQGMVQISVGCYHLISGNLKGASSQFRKGIKKLKDYEPSFLNINLQLLIEKIEPIIIELDDCSSKVEPNKFWDKIPRIDFIK